MHNEWDITFVSKPAQPNVASGWVETSCACRYKLFVTIVIVTVTEDVIVTVTVTVRKQAAPAGINYLSQL